MSRRKKLLEYNTLIPAISAYPSTGSFSRTAIKARSGVKTPIAGIFSAAVVVLALYALTPAFYYIPNATLSAVVIHAVADLVSGPNYVKRLASVSLLELFVFVAAVIITFFTTVEYGIYVSVALSALILLFRIARPRFSGLGRIPLLDSRTEDGEPRYLYVPFTHPSLGKLVETLPPGILMCRVDESFTYPNSGYIADVIIQYCKSRTRRAGKVLSKGERAWNDDGDPKKDAERAQLPRLHALILDFAAVNRLDSSGLQALVDIQSTLNRYADHHVEFHFVNLTNPTIRRALLAAGFGTQPRATASDDDSTKEPATEIFPIVPASKDGPQRLESIRRQQSHVPDVESKDRDSEKESITRSIPIPKDRYPFFHWSADEAVQAALQTLANRPPTVNEE